MARKMTGNRIGLQAQGVGPILALLVVLFASPAMASEHWFDYMGSDACAECHEKQWNEWTASGHPYKLMKSEAARNRPIPLPQGYSWDDISYVIGGYKWKSRYIDRDGYIITVTQDEDGNPVDGVNQYNYLTGQWSDYHAGEANKPYDCGSCHTTGWVADTDAATDGDLSDNQDGLPGMHGTFEAGGIQCEACHGPGYWMEIDYTSAACGECHVRGDANTIPASNGFIRHHEQYNEHLASPHAELFCIDCHDPHKRGEYSIKEGRTCSDCHTDQAASYAQTSMFAVGVECTDCHMPMASKSAQALGPYAGDVKTHLFSINTDLGSQDMFTEDGAFVRLDGDGKASVNLDFACRNCHRNQTVEWAAEYAEGFHDTGEAAAAKE